MNGVDYSNAQQVGAMLRGFGVNLLVREVPASRAFLVDVFDFQVLHESDGYCWVPSQPRETLIDS